MLFYLLVIVTILWLVCASRINKETKDSEAKLKLKHKSYLWICARGWGGYRWEGFLKYPQQDTQKTRHQNIEKKYPPSRISWYSWASYIPIQRSEKTLSKKSVAHGATSNEETSTQWVDLYIPETESVRTGIIETVIPDECHHEDEPLGSSKIRHVCIICFGRSKPKFITARTVICQRCINLIRDSIVDLNHVNKTIRNASFRLKVREDELLAGSVSKRLRGEEKECIKLQRAISHGLLLSSDTPVQNRPDRQAWARLRKLIDKEDGRKCALCGVKKPLHLHHIIPLFQRGTNQPANLVWLCERCHKKQHSFWV